MLHFEILVIVLISRSFWKIDFIVKFLINGSLGKNSFEKHTKSSPNLLWSTLTENLETNVQSFFGAPIGYHSQLPAPTFKSISLTDSSLS